MPGLTLQQAFDLALAHHQGGRLAEAEATYRQILEAAPRHADVLHLLGIVTDQMGRHEAGAELILRAIALAPSTPVFHCNLAEIWRKMGRLDEAIAACRRALQLKPDYAKAHNNLGATLSDQGNFDDAIAAYRRAIELQPDLAEAHYNLGVALTVRGQPEAAIAEHRRAIALRPTYAEAYNNLGNLLRDQKLPEEADAALRRALQFKPNFPEAHNNLGNVLKEQGRPDEAIASYRRAIKLKPDYADAHNNLGAALKDQAQLEEAIAEYRTAIQLKPDSAELASNLLLTLHYLPAADARTLAAEHQRWNRLHAEPLAKSIEVHTNHRDSERRLRVGYVSPDFHDHVVGRNLLPLFERHDRDLFEVTCYSGVVRPDGMTERFRALAGRWRGILGTKDGEVEAMVRADRVDILVDLSQHGAGNRLPLFARSPAPVQVSFAGYPAGAGLDAIGNRISDKYLEGGSATAAYGNRERVFLIDTFWCYDPCGIEMAVGALPAKLNRTITFGCLNNFCKVNGPVLALWARVLRQVNGSRLMLLSPVGSHRQRTLETLAREGIEAGRVEFVAPRPRAKYLELYHRMDIALDTFPYDGHTTSLDALWMGVPVVSLAGQLPVARAGLSQLSNLGLPELVAQTEDDYVRIAGQWAGNLSRLAGLRATLRPRMKASVLMDAPHFARQIEQAYRQMWRARCAKQCSNPPS